MFILTELFSQRINSRRFPHSRGSMQQASVARATVFVVGIAVRVVIVVVVIASAATAATATAVEPEGVLVLLIGGRGQCGGLRVAVSSFPFAQPRHDLSMGGGGVWYCAIMER